MNTIFSSSLKKICASLLLAGTISSFALAASHPSRTDVSERAKKALSSTFPKAEGISWIENNKANTFTAYFTSYDVKTVANFNKDGDMVSVLRYYKEDHLPVAALSLFRTKYADKTIAGVTEFTQDEEVTYYITCQDSARWYTVKISGNDMEETQRLNKL